MIRGTGIDSAVKLYLKGNGANGSTKFFDDSQNHISLTTNGTATNSTTISKFGGSSISFGTGGSITVPASSIFNYGSQFAYVFWLYYPALPSTNTRVFSQNDTGITFYLNLTDTGLISNGTGHTISSRPTAGELHYCVIIYKSNTMTYYLDGVSKMSFAATDIDLSAYPLYISTYNGSGQPLVNGYIDDFILMTGDAMENFDPTIIPTRQRG